VGDATGSIRNQIRERYFEPDAGVRFKAFSLLFACWLFVKVASTYHGASLFTKSFSLPWEVSGIGEKQASWQVGTVFGKLRPVPIRPEPPLEKSLPHAKSEPSFENPRLMPIRPELPLKKSKPHEKGGML
jgi:hypothetical protein